MAEPTVTSQYGNFGEATYDIVDHEWRFERSLDAITFRSLDQQPQESDDTQSATNQSRDSPQPSTADRLLDLDELINPDHDFPDGDQPFRSLLHSLLSVSEAVNTAADEYDALLGNRIANGWIISSNRRPLSVLANVSGPGGSDVTISCLRNFRQGWNDDKHSWLKTPKPTEQSTTWKGPGAPVQQVCIQDKAGNSQDAVDGKVVPFVAIRLPDRTTILQVREEEASLTISNAIDILEGCQHAHVSFNPWFGRQLAIVSVDGSWRVWDIQGIRKLRAKILVSKQGGTDLDSERIYNDGWARINFVGALDVVAVSIRRQILLYQIRQDAEQVGSLKLQLRKGKADVVLETTVLPSHTSHLIVLTSIHLNIFFITEDVDRINNQCILRLHHYANADDVSLHMITFMSKDDIMIWIRSRITTFSIIYKISDLNQTYCSYSGPFACETESPLNRLRTSDLACIPIDSMISTNPNDEGTLFQADVEQGVTFYQLFYVTSNHELQHSRRMLGSGKVTIRFTPPDWERRNPSSGKDRVMEDITTKPRSRQASTVRSKKKKIKSFHIDLEEIAEQLDQPLDDLQDLNTALDVINHDLKNAAVDESMPFSRLADLLDDGHTVQLQNLKDSSTQLRELLDRPSTSRQDLQLTDINLESRQWKVQTISMPASFSSINLSDPNEIYDSVVASWITPLSSDVDGRTRIQKNRIAQHMTAEIVLAGNIVRPLLSERRENLELANSESGQQQDDDLAFSQFDTDYPMTQEADSIPSLGPPTPTSIVADQNPSLAAAQFRIGQYTTFTKHLPTLSKSVQNMLRHWEVGQDPSQYNYNLYDGQIQREMKEESDRLTNSDRDLEKKQKREEKRLRKQREEAQASQQERFMNSQLPILAISASQPVDGRSSRYRDVQSQPDFMQATQSSRYPAVASQIQQGRHGGRPVKKKPRQAGF